MKTRKSTVDILCYFSFLPILWTIFMLGDQNNSSKCPNKISRIMFWDKCLLDMWEKKPTTKIVFSFYWKQSDQNSRLKQTNSLVGRKKTLENFSGPLTLWCLTVRKVMARLATYFSYILILSLFSAQWTVTKVVHGFTQLGKLTTFNIRFQRNF